MNKISLILLLIAFVGGVSAQTNTVFDGAEYKVEKLDKINSVASDISPMLVDGKLCFISIRKDLFSRKIKAKNNKAFYDAYSVAIDTNGMVTSERTLEPGFGFNFHEGPIAYCAATGELFSTSSNLINTDSVRKMMPIENIRLGLVIKKMVDTVWQTVEVLPFNSDQYNLAHPAINKTGDTLIFVSNMPGGIGGNDLYISVRKDGKWSTPENMGATVNTVNNEMFPFLTENGLLIFSSDGFGGLGGLDVVYTLFPIKEGVPVVNIGDDINSKADDFSFVITPNNKFGYFASNREGGIGNDDIYYYKVSAFDVKVACLAREGGIPLAGAKVIVMNEAGARLGDGTSTKDGSLTLKLNVGQKYLLKVKKEGFQLAQKNIDLTNLTKVEALSETVLLDADYRLAATVVDLQNGKPIPGAKIAIYEVGITPKPVLTDASGKAMVNVVPDKKYIVKIEGDNFYSLEDTITTTNLKVSIIDREFKLYTLDKGTRIEINNIYYEFDKWEVSDEATLVLDNLISILNSYPRIKIKLESHTDSRGPAEYNLMLSAKRAESCYNYLIAHGIKSNRIKNYEGLGESQLVNRCTDDVRCSNEAHAKNRRTVIEIVKGNGKR